MKIKIKQILVATLAMTASGILLFMLSSCGDKDEFFFSDSEFRYKVDDNEATIVSFNELEIARTSIKIPATVNHKDNIYQVTEIESNAFKNYLALETVDFSSATNLEEIDDHAFLGCAGLKGVLDLPANIDDIGDGAFKGCNKLTGIKVNGYTEIDDDAFASCSNATTVYLANNVTVDKNAFAGCSSIADGGLSLSQ